MSRWGRKRPPCPRSLRSAPGGAGARLRRHARALPADAGRSAAPGAPLLEWLEGTIFPEEARFARRGLCARRGRRVRRARSRRGHHDGLPSTRRSGERATDVLFEALAASGLRALAGLTLMDQRCPEAAPRAPRRGHGRLRAPRRALARPRRRPPRLRRHAALRAELLRARSWRTPPASPPIAACSCRPTSPSSPAEGVAVLAEHPFAADYLGVYEARRPRREPHALRPRHPPLGVASGIGSRRRGARVAHCPDSNFFLGSGRMRLAAARARAASPSASAATWPRAGASTCGARWPTPTTTRSASGDRVSAEELFTMATLGGARALGLDARDREPRGGQGGRLRGAGAPVPRRGRRRGAGAARVRRMRGGWRARSCGGSG